jgi:hypothetical protein
VKTISYEALHYAGLSIFQLLLSLTLGHEHFPQLPVLSSQSSLWVKEEVSRSCKTTGKIIVLFMLILGLRMECCTTKDYELNGRKHSPDIIFSVLPDLIFICYCRSEIFELCDIFIGFINHL